jgi:hypothetical protein
VRRKGDAPEEAGDDGDGDASVFDRRVHVDDTSRRRTHCGVHSHAPALQRTLCMQLGHRNVCSASRADALAGLVARLLGQPVTRRQADEAPRRAMRGQRSTQHTAMLAQEPHGAALVVHAHDDGVTEMPRGGKLKPSLCFQAQRVQAPSG